MKGEESSDDKSDLVPENEMQEAQIRDLASHSTNSLQETANKMQDNSAAMGRWILASLLAINTGGAAGVLANSDKVVGSLGTPILAFGLGATLAVLTGVNGLVTGLRAGPTIGNSIELLRLSFYESRIDGSTKREIAKLGPILQQQITISALLALSSLIAFASGVTSAVL